MTSTKPYLVRAIFEWCVDQGYTPYLSIVADGRARVPREYVRDGQIVIGAEQWPECLNPVTECANSSWYVWTVANNLMPGVYATTNDQHYKVTDLVTGEPAVVVAG